MRKEAKRLKRDGAELLEVLESNCIESVSVKQSNEEVQIVRFGSSRKSSPELLRAVWGGFSYGILIRKCYLDLWKLIQERLSASPSLAFVVGCRGVGKSGFLIYALLMLFREKRTVLFETKCGERYLFLPSTLFSSQYQVSNVTDEKFHGDSETYVLLDNGPDLVDASRFAGRVLVTWPLESNQQLLPGASIFYMPAWLDSECLIAGKELYAHDKPEEQNYRLKVAYLLEKKKSPTVEDLATSTTLRDLLALIGKHCCKPIKKKLGRLSPPSYWDWLLIMDAEDNYQDYSLCFSSLEIANSVLKALLSYRPERFVRFMTVEGPCRHVIKLKRQLFAANAIQALQKGGKFEARRVFRIAAPRPMDSFQISPLQLFWIDLNSTNNKVLPAPLDKYLFCSWDFCFKVRDKTLVMFQMMFGCQKGVRVSTRKQIEKLSFPLKNVILVLVTSQEKLKSLAWQPWLLDDEELLEASKLDQKSLNDVCQISIAVPWLDKQ